MLFSGYIFLFVLEQTGKCCMYSKQVCVRERDQEDLYLAYSELKYYTHLCNAVEYCSKFSIPPYVNQFFKKNIYLSIYL